jgi:hypothetical protein
MGHSVVVPEFLLKAAGWRLLSSSPANVIVVLGNTLTIVLSIHHLQDADLREAAALLQQALNAETVQQEEALWTQVGGFISS